MNKLDLVDTNVVIGKGSTAKRLQKINKLYDESTKDFKQQQKQDGIKKMEKEILAKAKANMSKIEAYKKKLRDSVRGENISNNLRNMSDENIKNMVERFRQRDFS